jgi:hypothetical protein
MKWAATTNGRRDSDQLHNKIENVCRHQTLSISPQKALSKPFALKPPTSIGGFSFFAAAEFAQPLLTGLVA